MLYTIYTLRFHMILMHDQQNPLTMLLYAPKPSCNIQHAKIYEFTAERDRSKETESSFHSEHSRGLNRVPSRTCILACLNQLRYRCHYEKVMTQIASDEAFYMLILHTVPTGWFRQENV